MSRIHRFYVGTTVELRQSFWLQDDRLLHQWNKVLRYQAGQEVLLFDGVQIDRLYRIEKLTSHEAQLSLVTEYARNVPSKDVYLLWSLLKKDKNDWVLQKATELGVTHLVPLLAARSEKTGFDHDRSLKIVIEAAEQCGRSDIPNVREPMLVQTAVEHVGSTLPLLVCQKGGDRPEELKSDTYGVLIGPEGGWTDDELALFDQHKLAHLGLGDFVLRAETAAVVAASIQG